jgi:trehalose 6-phosphate synthase/phosphatase
MPTARVETYPQTSISLPDLPGDLIIVSNRLPCEVKPAGNGLYVAKNTFGGLVTGVQPLARGFDNYSTKVRWLGNAGEGEPEGLMEALRTASDERGIELGMIDIDHSLYKLYYGTMSNRIYWPFLHDRGLEKKALDFIQKSPDEASEAGKAYRKVNRQFARSIIDQTNEQDTIWIQDYHLFFVGEEMRKLGSKQTIGFFLHIPFPNATAIEKMPDHKEVLNGLLSYDTLGFHTKGYVKNFEKTIEKLVPEAQIIHSPNGLFIKYRDHLTKVAANPISIDPYEFSNQAKQQETKVRAGELKGKYEGEWVIIDVARSDYTKGIPERLKAVDHLLNAHGHLRGRLRMVQAVAKNRSGIPEYDQIIEEIDNLVEEINARHKSGSWVPVIHDGAMDRAELLAHYSIANAGAITPLADGMNLVAKEFVVCAPEDSALLLSPYAGVWEEFQQYAYGVNPTDKETYAEIMHDVRLKSILSPRELRDRMMAMRGIVYDNTVFQWGERAIRDFQDLKPAA